MTSKKSSTPRASRDPFLEALRDLGKETGRVAKEELVGGIAKDFLPEMFGLNRGNRSKGDLRPGESISFEEKYAKEVGSLERAKRQLFYERSLQREVQVVVEEDKQQLQMKIQAVRQEIASLGKAVVQLEEVTKEAEMVAPVDPGVYHVNFFEALKNFVIDLRKTVFNTVEWMNEANGRANKKKMKFWGKYKSLGSKFYLSSEHYLTRSAG